MLLFRSPVASQCNVTMVSRNTPTAPRQTNLDSWQKDAGLEAI